LLLFTFPAHRVQDLADQVFNGSAAALQTSLLKSNSRLPITVQNAQYAATPSLMLQFLEPSLANLSKQAQSETPPAPERPKPPIIITRHPSQLTPPNAA
jgi:hypothetical protein